MVPLQSGKTCKNVDSPILLIPITCFLFSKIAHVQKVFRPVFTWVLAVRRPKKTWTTCSKTTRTTHKNFLNGARETKQNLCTLVVPQPTVMGSRVTTTIL